MRRVTVAIAVVASLVVVLVIARGRDDDAYRVRAIFDNAFALTEGEDVKVAGVRVGVVDALDVTPQRRAAVVLRIDRPGFGGWRADATCSIRPQSLIGERFVACTPTRPRRIGVPAPPPLTLIPAGRPGAGQHLLPVTQTSRPVDLDLLGNVMQRPFRERLTIVLSELGTGLSGRGPDLRAAIRRANPALAETDRVLAILARQSRALADLARRSDAALGPLARDRARMARFIRSAGLTAAATARRRVSLERSLRRLPRFLDELRPTLRRVSAVAAQGTPLLADLESAAAPIIRVVQQLGPLARAARPAVAALGRAADVGRGALVRARPTIADLRRLATDLRPVGGDLARTLGSLETTGGVRRLMDLLFFSVSATNGFDALGHYLRAGLVVNVCSTFATAPDPGCSANFSAAAVGASAATARSAASRRRVAQRGARHAPGPDPRPLLDLLLGGSR